MIQFWQPQQNPVNCMMTSLNGNIFHVTDPLCGEFIVNQWILLTKANDAELWWVFYLHLNKRLSKQSRRRWFEMPSCSLWHRCNGWPLNHRDNFCHIDGQQPNHSAITYLLETDWHQLNRGPFHEQFFHNSILMANLFQCNSNVGYHVTTKFCTCHNSTAVIPCAKFHSDHFTITWMRLEWTSHCIWITMEQSYNGPQYYMPTTTVILPLETMKTDHWAACPGSGIYIHSGAIIRESNISRYHIQYANDRGRT